MDKPLPAGWVIRLLTPAPTATQRTRGGMLITESPSERYFNAAVANPDGAIAAATKHIGFVPEAGMLTIVRRLSEPELATLKIGIGEVQPA